MRILHLFLLLLAGISATAQQPVTVMCYNLLNFPTGNLAGREDTLRTIIDHVRPDIFLLQELKTDSGLQLIVDRSFAGLPGTYAATTFVPQQSNTGGFLLQQAMVYNTNLFGLLSETYLMTAVRDINRFCLYWKDPLLAQGADTVKLYLFVTHLKSSQGTDNVAARLSMVQTFTTHLQYLPANASVIFAGDLNVYTSTEPAYQELLDPTNAIVMRDPIDSPGSWQSSSFAKREIHTQSTRASAIFGDGAGGGLDDRFDFILLSRNMMGPVHSITYTPDTYNALGNDGTCYNESITACAGGEVPYAVMRAMYNMSDHLPVVMQLQFTSGISGVGEHTAQAALWWASVQGLHVQWPVTEPVTITLTDMLGRTVHTTTRPLGPSVSVLPMPALGRGVYLVRMAGRQHTAVAKVVWGG
jgi:endonuclease/exonuclease/phosphatase family metal-dependent hydrolase